MSHLVVLAQASLVFVRLVAYVTLESHLIVLVLLHVLTQVGPRFELLSADRALVRRLARVDSLVAVVVAHLRERLAADLALVRLPLLVDASVVLLQGGVLGEAGAADVALVGPLARVGALVLQLRLLAGEGLVAAGHAARKLELHGGGPIRVVCGPQLILYHCELFDAIYYKIGWRPIRHFLF